MQAHTLPTRIVVNNKLIYTEKLVADLHFWSEVERCAIPHQYGLFRGRSGTAATSKMERFVIIVNDYKP